jgi:hypothetical protein
MGFSCPSSLERQEPPMLSRPMPILAVALVAAAVGAAPAGAQAPTDQPAPGAAPGACTDQAAPTSRFTQKSARRARRTRVVRGTAADVGCGIDHVTISVNRKSGKRCRPLTTKHRLGRAGSCTKRTWLPVKGSSSWSFKLPKRLSKGTYVIRTRAADFAGNVEKAHGQRVKLTKTKAKTKTKSKTKGS